MQAAVPEWLRDRNGICGPAPPSPRTEAEGTNRKQQGTWGPAAEWVSRVGGCSVTCPTGLEREHAVTGLESTVTYWVLRSTVWTKAGFVSMEAVTRDVSRDQYHIAEASETETPDFLTLWKPTALRPWILVSCSWSTTTMKLHVNMKLQTFKKQSPQLIYLHITQSA